LLPVAILFLLDFLKQTENIHPEKFSEFADAHCQNSPVDPAPAAITAALAMHVGHILPSS
jgi:hypothetical protein